MKKKDVEKVKNKRIYLPNEYLVDINDDGTKWEVSYFFDNHFYHVMGSDTNQDKELLPFIKKAKEWDFSKIFGIATIIINWLLLIFCGINAIFKNDILSGFIWGCLFLTFVSLFIRLLVNNHNSNSFDLKHDIRLEIIKYETEKLKEKIKKETEEKDDNKD